MQCIQEVSRRFMFIEGVRSSTLLMRNDNYLNYDYFFFTSSQSALHFSNPRIEINQTMLHVLAIMRLSALFRMNQCDFKR